MKPGEPRPPPTRAQARAADPACSVWVTADAGTGKTRVLSDRVLRLLLSGADPEGILCITFTKAAAAEMIARVERDLARWAMMRDEGALEQDLRVLLGREPEVSECRLARSLFAYVLELPHGLPIMTIHSFCTSILQRFPLEAGIAAHFETIDERTASELMAEARLDVLAAAHHPDDPLSTSIGLLATTLADTSLDDLMREILAKRLAFQEQLAVRGGAGPLASTIARWLEVDPDVPPPALLAAACADGAYDAHRLKLLADALVSGNKTQKMAAQAIAAWLNAHESDRQELFENYKAAFLTKKGEGRKDILTDGIKREHAAAADAYALEQARLVRLADAIKAWTVHSRTTAALEVAQAIIRAYETIKERRAALDFDDLVLRTRDLLSRAEVRAWVLYKLDARLSHLLIDEAQDTSPAQWAIIEALAAELAAGEGAHGHMTGPPRTLFIVGDEKQSIYSFQGADLDELRSVRVRIGERFEQAAFTDERLVRSFRSTRAVLETVDAVLALPEASPGVVSGTGRQKHESARHDEPGLVELWPLIEPPAAATAQEPWPLPDAQRIEEDAEQRQAKLLADHIAGWLETGEMLASGQPIRAADIIVLVQRRGLLQELLINALKRKGVPVAGADRLRLTDHIAVQDLVALGRFVLLPEDDLNLACLLKSPLVGLGEEALFSLAHGRGTDSLLARLRAAAASDPDIFAHPLALLEQWRRRSDFVPPYEFYGDILSRGGGRKRLLERLGPDALQPIEAFLAQALAYEEGHPASLEGFLHWLGLEEETLKRDPAPARNEVRVMTVHGSKGLEAPVVVLADAGPRGTARPDRILFARDSGLPFWRMARDERDPRTKEAVKAEEAAQECERMRLLYVALTRAGERLHVSGWKTRKGSCEGCWHDLVARALRELRAEEVAHDSPFTSGPILRLARGRPAEPKAPPEPAATSHPLPAWAGLPAPKEPPAITRLLPSRIGESEPAAASPLALGSSAARSFGAELHRLLHGLAGIAPPLRHERLERHLERLDLPPEDRQELARQVMAVLTMPELAPAFGPGSRGEQPIAGRIETADGPRIITGQIDRFAVSEEAVFIVDFKSDRMAPETIEQAPTAYLRQLAGYAVLLQRLHPGHAVRTGLVWTRQPRLDLVPLELLVRHMPLLAPRAPAPA